MMIEATDGVNWRPWPHGLRWNRAAAWKAMI